MLTIDSELHNQQYLIDQSGKLFPLAKRHKFPVSLMKIEVDNYEEMYKKYGQSSWDDTWDNIVECIGILIKSTSRQEDTVVRYNNVKFAILLPYCNVHSAIDKAERLRKAVLNLKPDQVDISASFGVAGTSTDDMCDWDTLIEAASNCLNQAKVAGGNCVKSEAFSK